MAIPRRSVWVTTLALTCAAVLTACGGGGSDAPIVTEPAPATPVATSIKSVSTVSRIFGDGQKVVYAVAKYDGNVDGASLSTDSYAVKYTEASGAVTTRKVVGAFTSDGAFLAQGGVNTVGPNSPTGTGRNTTPVTVAEIEKSATGPYVVIKLEVQSPILTTSLSSDGRPATAGTVTPITAVSVTQQRDVKTASGGTYAASPDVVASTGNGKVLVREQYEMGHFYTDAVYGTTVFYNIYKPRGYEGRSGKYPLVVFVPDAGHLGTDSGIPMMQGNGGTVWADPNWHAAGGEEAFVVAMAIKDRFINDYWEYYGDVTNGIIGAIRNLIASHPEIDPNRIYATGQSMGAMNALVMMALDRQATKNGYPSPGAALVNGRVDNTPQTRDLFTAGMIVAGQWDTDEMASIGDSRLFVVSSADDGLSSTWTNKAVARWVTGGHEVVRGWINGASGFSLATSGYAYDPAAHRAVVSSMLDKGKNVQQRSDGTKVDAHLYYLSFAAGTGTHDAKMAPTAGGHFYTWKLGYDLPLVKEWILAQKGNFTSASILDASGAANAGSGPRDANSPTHLITPQAAATWNPAAGESWADFSARLDRDIPTPTP